MTDTYPPHSWEKHDGIQTPYPNNLVSNQCCDCGYAWIDGPGVFGQEQCPACNSLCWKAGCLR